MATFSVNQNRNVYVVGSYTKDKTADPTTDKEIVLKTTKDGDKFGKVKTAAGILRTDLIQKGHVLSVDNVGNTHGSHTLKSYLVTLDEAVKEGDNVIPSRDYILQIVIDNYIGMSDEDTYFKYGCVRGTKDMTASKFYATLGVSLAKNFSREIDPMLKFYLKTATGYVEVKASDKADELKGAYTGVLVAELDTWWELGKGQYAPTRFHVHCGEVAVDLEDEDEVVWGNVEEVTGIDNINTVIPNGRMLADLEYFCAGERGDIYRSIGWPFTISTRYDVDPTKSYYTVDVHYAFTDEGVHVQKSEKQMTFITEYESVATAIEEFFNQ
jgi:hypothetical protein